MSPVNANSLLSGIGVVIDDMAKAGADQGDPIQNLIEQIQDARIPVLVYESLPSEDERSNFNNATFILLDWELWKGQQLQGQAYLGGEELERQGIEDNIAFLKSLREVCFAPVFIFSHYGVEGIKAHLRDAQLLQEPDDRSFILVRHKEDLKRSDDDTDSPLLNAVNTWMSGNPSIYVLTQWNAEVARSQTRLFWDLYDKDPAWPSVLWRAYEADHDSPDHALADVLLRNMRARMSPLTLSPEHVVPESVPEPSTQTLRAVLEASVMVSAEGNRLPTNQYGCGDVFRLEDANGPLYRLNIRCDCDCIAHDGHPERVLLYLLKGRIVHEADFTAQDSEYFSEAHGIARPMKEAYVFPMDGGNCVAFSFHDIKTIKVSTLLREGATRIGRLTAPYITDIRQRYSQWLQREGFPKIPALAVRKAGTNAERSE